MDARFYITESGDYVPSVTTYLESYPRTAQFYESLKSVGKDADEIRDTAGRSGSVVHDLTERYDNGEDVSLMDESGYIGYKLQEWSQFEKWVEFRQAHETVIIHNELNLVSDLYKMGGTLDRVMYVKGQLLLVDIKTSNAIYPHYWLQLEAYRRMLMEINKPVDGVAIMWLAAKTRTDGKAGTTQGKGWQLIIKNDLKEFDKDWKLFQACQALWNAENSDAKPREINYSLKHKLNGTDNLPAMQLS